MKEIISDWRKVQTVFEEMRRARSLPERFKLTMDYNAQCCEFVQKHFTEIDNMVDVHRWFHRK